VSVMLTENCPLVTVAAVRVSMSAPERVKPTYTVATFVAVPVTVTAWPTVMEEGTLIVMTGARLMGITTPKNKNK
jgi:hypothetical protein